MQAEKDQIEAERAENQRMMQELLALKAQLDQQKAPATTSAPTEPAVEPAVESEAEPAVEPAVESKAEPAVEPATESVDEPTDQSHAE